MQYSFEDAVEGILSRHSEYPSEAYAFMRQALEVASDHFHKTEDEPHLSAEELYLGTCAHALEEYGPLARLILSRWGIQSSSDIGAIVYNLIEAGVFGRQEGDTREQFDKLRSLGEILDAPYESPDTPLPDTAP